MSNICPTYFQGGFLSGLVVSLMIFAMVIMFEDVIKKGVGKFLDWFGV